MKLLKKYHWDGCEAWKEKLRPWKWELQQHGKNVADQAISIVENKLNTNKWSLEKRRISKIARLLESQTSMQPTNRHPHIRASLPHPHDHSDNPRMVANLYDIELTEAEHHRGLKFALKPPGINTFQLKQDLEDFDRRLHLQEFSYEPEDEQDTPQRRWLKEKSTWPSIKTERVSLKHTSEQWRKTSVIWQTTPRPRRYNLNQTKMSLRLYCCFYKL